MRRGAGDEQQSYERPRAQSAMVGFVLLLGVVALVSAGIFVLGSETATEVTQQAETDRVEGAFLELSQEMATTAPARDATQSISLATDDRRGDVVRTDAGTIRVERDDTTVNASLGTLEYAGRDGTRLVYQAGGVWRVTDDGVALVSEPNVHYEDRTLTVPVPVLSGGGEQVVGDDPVSLATERSDSLYAGPNDELSSITIESEFYEWWGGFFEEVEADSRAVTALTDDAAGTATLRFDDGSAGGGASTPIVLDSEGAVETEGTLVTADGGGSGTDGDVFSRDGVDVRHRVDGNVTSGGDVTLHGEGEVTGRIAADGDVIYGDGTEANDIIAGGDVAIKGSVDGDVYAYGDVTVHHGTVTGELVANGSVDVRPWHCSGGCSTTEYVPTAHVGPHPRDYTDEIPDREPLDDFYAEQRATADAKGPGTLEGGDRLDAGTYVVDAIDVDRGSLEFDVAGGNVTVFVNDSIHLDDEGEIRVYNSDGRNATRLFTDGPVDIRGGGKRGVCAVPNPGVPCGSIRDDVRDGDGFQLYGTSNASFTFYDQLEFHGILYAPLGPGATRSNAAVAAGGNVTFFGSVVVGSIDGTGEVTFERAEGGTSATPGGGGTASGSATDEVTYVHASVHEVSLLES